MTSAARTALRRAPAPLALMAVIFVLSAQPDLRTDLGVVDLIGRKLVHALAFGSLALLWGWALRAVTPRALALGAAIAFLYAIADEYHQTFVSGRSGSAVDVLIDSAGIALAAALALARECPRSARR